VVQRRLELFWGDVKADLYTSWLDALNGGLQLVLLKKGLAFLRADC